MSTVPFIRTPADLTSDWLSDALGRPGLELLSTSPIGTGQMSQSHRVTFTATDDDCGAQETVVVKLASDNETSRATGVGMGAYFREVAFYRNLSTKLDGPLPVCHLAEYDEAEGWFTLVLEDIEGASQGDQIAGCTVEEARSALQALARIQAPVLGDLHVGASDWLNLANPLTEDLLKMLLPAFLERYGDRIAPEHAEVCKTFVPRIAAAEADVRPPFGLVHGDYRLDNLLYAPDGSCKAVDWQTVTWGPAMTDAAYLVGGGLSVEDRRAHEETLIREYHAELLAQGVRNLDWDTCWDGYRRGVFHGILMVVAASMVTERTDRGDDMFMAWLERNAQQILDLDSLSLLPEPDAGRPAPLQPAAEDEGLHEPGTEPLWNESYYFDAISDDGSLGMYVRVGRLPNQGLCLYTACICGPDRPSIMLVTDEAPLPADDDTEQVIDVDGLRAVQTCEEPLKRFRVTLDGTAQAHEDPSAPLRGERGEPVEVSFDLVWDTDGVPYAWRRSTRYEIPCRVTGTITIGDEELAFSGPGQRDHSHGARDWWAVDWMWSGLHFDDGTHTHAVGIPQMPGYGVGYVQKDGEVLEIETVNATEVVAANELISSARIESGPDTLAIDVEPVAWGAIRLDAPDGRLSYFPRAMCRLTTDDGRTGTGWVEWNRVQREEA